MWFHNRVPPESDISLLFNYTYEYYLCIYFCRVVLLLLLCLDIQLLLLAATVHVPDGIV